MSRSEFENKVTIHLDEREVDLLAFAAVDLESVAEDQESIARRSCEAKCGVAAVVASNTSVSYVCQRDICPGTGIHDADYFFRSAIKNQL